MSKTWLILDVSALAHRAMHSTGGLSKAIDGESMATGVLYGLFRDIINFQKEHRTNHIAFCFDKGKSIRETMLPTYKETRKKKRAEAPQEEKDAYVALQSQIKKLRDEYLPYIGYANIFAENGFEADDLIAAGCQALREDEQAILIGRDADLLQLLSKRVMLWDPTTKLYKTREKFKKQWGLKPKQWAMVKAIAGCDGDDVKGVRGVGEATAAKYLRGELTKGKKFQDIISQEDKWKKNIALVKLPHEECPPVEFRDDNINIKRWNKVMKKLGMKSLIQDELVFGF